MDRIPRVDGLKHILDLAISVDGAIGGAIQLLRDDQCSLQMVEACGLPPEYFARFAVVTSGTGSSCTQAFTERRRVVIRDVDCDPGFAPFREYALAAGYCGVQSTPLIDRDRRLRGVLSTYYRQPHHPTPESLQEIDRCCLAAVLLLECADFSVAVDERDQRLGLPLRSLSPAGAQAADAARRLLSVAGDERQMTLDPIIRNLEVVTAELSGRLKRRSLGEAANA